MAITSHVGGMLSAPISNFDNTNFRNFGCLYLFQRDVVNFYTNVKHQKAVKSFDIFKEYRNLALDRTGLNVCNYFRFVMVPQPKFKQWNDVELVVFSCH